MEGLHTNTNSGLSPNELGMIPRSLHRIFYILNEACPIQAKANKVTKPNFAQLAIKQPSNLNQQPNNNNNQSSSPTIPNKRTITYSAR
jgi:hypothetical protein